VRGDDQLARVGEAEAAGDVLEAGDGLPEATVRVAEVRTTELYSSKSAAAMICETSMGVACRCVWWLAWPGRAREVSNAAGGAALDPEDGVGVVRFEQKGEVGGDVGGAFAQAGGLVDILEAVEFAFEAGEGVERAGVGVAAFFEELGAGEKGMRPSAGLASSAAIGVAEDSS
jgi:hypothetical protein